MTTLPQPAVQAVQAALHAIPMNRTLGVHITGVGVGRADGTCAVRPDIQNHIGTIHAAAQFCLAEAVSGAACAGAFVAHLDGATPLIEKLETHYVAIARGDVTAHAEAEPADVASAQAAYAQDGKARLLVPVRVTDSEGKVVMQALAHWYLRKNNATTR
ncbi:DUF4442 domain-containing protein [Deinococcus maricopensis]|uniref:DUF4442 domain-containing protein n=1 Tax=Deinococcus maricopensis (strain DSM 21211 / LMG 22137 / NRRL B-23946 / LB-34) TaxID=709986 RepID=E8U9N6_DEIML|nr:DUF4442 domain-containing protein [Deinococcus maricopensis]ADV67775.1 hypothetical protein Deima_2134 [Deinococcus maricopensis DSM 21211]